MTSPAALRRHALAGLILSALLAISACGGQGTEPDGEAPVTTDAAPTPTETLPAEDDEVPLAELEGTWISYEATAKIQTVSLSVNGNTVSGEMSNEDCGTAAITEIDTDTPGEIVAAWGGSSNQCVSVFHTFTLNEAGNLVLDGPDSTYEYVRKDTD